MLSGTEFFPGTSRWCQLEHVPFLYQLAELLLLKQIAAGLFDFAKERTADNVFILISPYKCHSCLFNFSRI